MRLSLGKEDLFAGPALDVKEDVVQDVEKMQSLSLGRRLRPNTVLGITARQLLLLLRVGEGDQVLGQGDRPGG